MSPAGSGTRRSEAVVPQGAHHGLQVLDDVDDVAAASASTRLTPTTARWFPQLAAAVERVGGAVDELADRGGWRRCPAGPGRWPVASSGSDPSHFDRHRGAVDRKSPHRWPSSAAAPPVGRGQLDIAAATRFWATIDRLGVGDRHATVDAHGDPGLGAVRVDRVDPCRPSPRHRTSSPA